MKHLKDGEDFGASHFDKSFGFHGSADGHGRPHTEHRAKGGAMGTTMKDVKSDVMKHRAMGAGSDDLEMNKGIHVSGDEDAGPLVSSTNPPSITDTMEGSRTSPSNLTREGGGMETDSYAKGGHHMGMHMHPHGHEVVDVEHGEHGVVMHHAHGGYTMHHHDGHVTHHAMGGEQCHAMGGPQMPMAGGQPPMPGRSPIGARPGMPMARAEGGSIGGGLPQYARGGDHEDRMSDKRMMTKAIHEHEVHDHPGEKETKMRLAPGGRMRTPRKMEPAAMKTRTELGGGMPVNKPPRNPARTTSPRNSMPGGQMGYGVEPSAEPDVADSDQGISGMSKGGHRRRA